jgi:L-malate glycosyltransferase
MNIGIVCYPTFGGSGVVATELGKSLALRGHKIHFITYDWPVRLGRFTQNVTFHEVRMMDYPLFHFPPYESALTSAMVDVARYNDIDLFHVHYAIPHASAGCMARDILKDMGKYVPVVTTLHGTDITLVGKNKSFEPVVSFSINHSDGVTAVSDYLRQATFDSFHVTNEIEVIPNFVDRERFFRQDKEHFRRIIAPNQEKIILHTSNFRKVKRTEDVMAIFRKIAEGIPSRMLMIGDGPERIEAESLSREWGLDDKVVFLGNQNPVEEIYSVGDLFLMPSETESFGLSALEAMSCGMPVITSNAGGLPEINVDGETGFACNVGDIDAMAQGGLRILRDEELHKRFSANAVKRSIEFSPEAIVPLYEAYYEKILARCRANTI